MNTLEDDKYISLEEATNYLGIKLVNLRSSIWDPSYEVPTYKISRIWEFKQSEIDAWVRSGKSAIEE